MSGSTGSLNLSPQERRLVAGVGLVVFVVLNVWLVWPHFGDWRTIGYQRDQAERTLGRYRTEVERTTSYQAKLRQLESMGQSVVAEEQELNLVRTVQDFASAAGLNITQSDSRARVSTTSTNQFFEEQAIKIGINSSTEALVAFLERLTATNSLIRVRELSVRPDTSQTRLMGDLTLVASYQKKAPARPAAGAAPAATTGATAATNVAVSGTKPATKSATTRTNRTFSGTATNRPAAAPPKPTASSPPKS